MNNDEAFAAMRALPVNQWAANSADHWSKAVKLTCYISDATGKVNVYLDEEKAGPSFCGYFSYNKSNYSDKVAGWAANNTKVVLEGAWANDGIHASNMKEYVETGIDGITVKNETANTAVYNLNGTLVNKNGSVEGLNKGIYIVNGKKVVVK